MAPPNPFWVQRYLRDHNLDALLGEAVNQVGVSAPTFGSPHPATRPPREFCDVGCSFCVPVTLQCIDHPFFAGGGKAFRGPRRLISPVLFVAIKTQRGAHKDFGAPCSEQVCLATHSSTNTHKTVVSHSWLQGVKGKGQWVSQKTGRIQSCRALC